MKVPDQSQFHKNLSKKSFEIGYALFRIADHVEKRGFADHIENSALRLLAATSSKDHAEVVHAMRGIEHLLILAGDANIVKQDVCDFVIGEIKGLYSAIIEFDKSKELPDIDLKGIFSPIPTSRMVTSKEQIQPIGDREIPMVVPSAPQEDSAGVEIRQSRILEKIRQSGSCRMKDVQELFPDMSERTLRYDLQDLMERGAIVRIGVSGPATYYQLRNS